MSVVEEQLAAHVQSRALLVAQLKAAIARDPDVNSAILHGSLGRGDADPWSDVDVVVFIQDEAIPRVVEHRLTLPHRLGEPVYLLDSPWNAPADGAQVNALYQLNSGLPVYVDWNLFPATMAGAPTDVQILHERQAGALPRLALTFAEWSTFDRQPRPDPAALPVDFVRHAWFGMVPIAAKFYARGTQDRLDRLLSGIGAQSHRDGEQAAIRERFHALATGEERQAIAAVAALIDAAERYRTHDQVGGQDAG